MSDQTRRDLAEAIAAHDQEVAEQRCLKICWHIDRLVEHADQMTRSDLLVALDNLSVTADSIARGKRVPCHADVLLEIANRKEDQ